jgi:hypothetical protein
VLGLTPRLVIPDHPQLTGTDLLEDTSGGTLFIESRRNKDIRIDDDGWRRHTHRVATSIPPAVDFDRMAWGWNDGPAPGWPEWMRAGRRRMVRLSDMWSRELVAAWSAHDIDKVLAIFTDDCIDEVSVR